PGTRHPPRRPPPPRPPWSRTAGGVVRRRGRPPRPHRDRPTGPTSPGRRGAAGSGGAGPRGGRPTGGPARTTQGTRALRITRRVGPPACLPPSLQTPFGTVEAMSDIPASRTTVVHRIG